MIIVTVMVKISKVPTRDDVPNTPIQVTSVTIDGVRLLAEPTAHMFPQGSSVICEYANQSAT